MTNSPKNTLWGGRFASGPSDLLRALNDSFSFDWELLAEDLEGSIAWVGALARAGVLTAYEATQLVSGLQAIYDDYVENGRPVFERLPVSEYEDVHSFVEASLRGRAGAIAAKLHTGRSRNDQVATDLRLYVRKAAAELREGALDLAATLAATAKATASVAMPGYTHLKQAEPVTFGHWCLAYAEMLQRDVRRIDALGDIADSLPLGSGALAGSPLHLDRQELAASLGFSRASANSLDAVSDRDAVADYLYAASLLLVHLSRLAEDVIFFSADETGFVTLPDAFATGSSRMPQKKNPDVLELVRGHAARAVGEVTGFLTLLKGLPLAYNKDLQLDKEPVFRMRRTIAALLPALNGLLAGLALDEERMRRAASSDMLLSTQLVDALVARGVAFRDAHEIVSRRIGESLAAGKSLKELGAGGGITAADLDAMSVEASLGEKRSLGGTHPTRVAEAAEAAAETIARLKSGGSQ